MDAIDKNALARFKLICEDEEIFPSLPSGPATTADVLVHAVMVGGEDFPPMPAYPARPKQPTVVDVLNARRAKAEQGPWVPACNGAEVPFHTRSGRILLYCWQPSTGRHAYLDCGTDIILSDEEARQALGTF